MATLPPRLIDCNEHPDLLAGWPVRDIVLASETAENLLFDLDSGWLLQGADLDGKGYGIDAEDMVITVDTGGLAHAAIQRSAYFQNIMTLRTMAALRAAWQAEREDDAFAMHRIDVWPLLNRVLSADIAAMTVRMAYELRDEEIETVWRHALGDETGDMAMAFARNGDMSACFLQWFEKDTRVSACDFETLNQMDADLAALTTNGRGQIGEGAIKCLTIDPISGASYLGPVAAEITGNPAWRSIENPVAEAHFIQIMDEIGSTRVGNVQMRDLKLAQRLFPDMLVRA